MQITGKTVYNDFEGGFWGIRGDDGVNYCPDAVLPVTLQLVGLPVVIQYERSSVVSFQQWGKMITILSIKKL